MILSFYLILLGILLLFGMILWQILRQRQMMSAKLKGMEEMLAAVFYKQQEERKELKKQFHDTLENDIVAAKNFLLLSERAQNEQQRSLFMNDTKIALDEAFKHTKALSDKVMPSLIKSGKIIEVLQNHFSALRSATGTIFEVNPESPNLEMPSALGYEIYCIISELCENVIKHSTATQVSLTLFSENEIIVLKLNDNGLPYDLKKCAENTEGKGLKIVYARLLALNGSLIQKKESKGNHIIIKMPCT